MPALLLFVSGGCGQDGGACTKSDASVFDATVASPDDGHADAGSDDDAGEGEASEPSAPPTDPGAACIRSSECSQQVCLDLPGGYCNARCMDDSACGAGNYCVSGYCYARCESHADCTRTGYFCTTLDLYVDEEGSLQLERSCYVGKTLGGTATIPEGLTVVVTDPAGGTIELSASGPFTLPNKVAFDGTYSVTFETHGDVPGIYCMGKALAGRALDDVTSISITCSREAVFTIPGTYAWIVPAEVTSVSVVAVGSGGRGYGDRGGGGGELCYENEIPVTPGETLQIVVGDLHSEASGGHDSSFEGTLVAHGGADAFGSVAGWQVSGGTGGAVGTCFDGGFGSYNSSAGGAAGYVGIGGYAYMYPEEPARDGAGSGSAGGGFETPGGGVGLEGIGENGIARGGNGSQASPEVPVAGGGGTTYNDAPQNGQHGGVRVIWGAGRSYPSQAGNQ